VNTPWRKGRCADYFYDMKDKNSQSHQDKKMTGASPPTTAAGLSQNEINFEPSADEVARRAYFNYENQGSVPGHDVQHWLGAEAELIAERNRTRIHGFHNRS
jgi:hypothetical protein